MKIKDVKIGEEYGVVRYGGKSAAPKNARRCEALEITTETEVVYQGWRNATRQVRRVRVRLLDAELPETWESVSGPAGYEFVTEARLLLDPWSAVGPAHLAAWGAELERIQTKERVSREAADMGFDSVTVSVMTGDHFYVRLNDDQWAQLVAKFGA